jgi:hypothetical protein
MPEQYPQFASLDVSVSSALLHCGCRSGQFSSASLVPVFVFYFQNENAGMHQLPTKRKTVRRNESSAMRFKKRPARYDAGNASSSGNNRAR